jgi:hypothetical protein
MQLDYALTLKIGDVIAFPGEQDVKWEVVDIITDGDPVEKVTLALYWDETSEIIEVSSTSWSRV